jgi:hypothetical protein
VATLSVSILQFVVQSGIMRRFGISVETLLYLQVCLWLCLCVSYLEALECTYVIDDNSHELIHIALLHAKSVCRCDEKQRICIVFLIYLSQISRIRDISY